MPTNSIPPPPKVPEGQASYYDKDSGTWKPMTYQSGYGWKVPYVSPATSVPIPAGLQGKSSAFNPVSKQWEEMTWVEGAGYMSPYQMRGILEGKIAFDGNAKTFENIKSAYSKYGKFETQPPVPKQEKPAVTIYEETRYNPRTDTTFTTGKYSGYSSDVLQKSIIFPKALTELEAKKEIQKIHLQYEIDKARAEQLAKGYLTATISPFTPTALRGTETQAQTTAQALGIKAPTSPLVEAFTKAGTERGVGYTWEGQPISIAKDTAVPYIVSVPTTAKQKEIAEAERLAEKEKRIELAQEYLSTKPTEKLFRTAITQPLEETGLALWRYAKGDKTAILEQVGKRREELYRAETEGYKILDLPFTERLDIKLPAGRIAVIGKQMWETPITQWLAIPEGSGRVLWYGSKVLTSISPTISVIGLKFPQLSKVAGKFLPKITTTAMKPVAVSTLAEIGLGAGFLGYTGYEISKMPTTEQKVITGLSFAGKGAVMMAGAYAMAKPSTLPKPIEYKKPKVVMDTTTAIKTLQKRETITWIPQEQLYKSKIMELAKRYSIDTKSGTFAIGTTPSGRLYVIEGLGKAKGIGFIKPKPVLRELAIGIRTEILRKTIGLPKGTLIGGKGWAISPETMSIRLAKAFKFKPKVLSLEIGAGRIRVFEAMRGARKIRMATESEIYGTTKHPTITAGVKRIRPSKLVKTMEYSLENIMLAKGKKIGKGLTFTKFLGEAKLRLGEPKTRIKTLDYFGSAKAITKELARVERQEGLYTIEAITGKSKLIGILRKTPKQFEANFRGIVERLKLPKQKVKAGEFPRLKEEPIEKPPKIEDFSYLKERKEAIEKLPETELSKAIQKTKEITKEPAPTIKPEQILKEIPSVTKKIVTKGTAKKVFIKLAKEKAPTDWTRVGVFAGLGERSEQELWRGVKGRFEDLEGLREREGEGERGREGVIIVEGLKDITRLGEDISQTPKLMPMSAIKQTQQQMQKQTQKTTTITKTPTITTQITPTITTPTPIDIPIIPPTLVLYGGQAKKGKKAKKPKPMFKTLPKKADILPIPDIISIVRTEATTWKQAKYPLPTPKVKTAFARAVAERPFAWKFPTTEMIKKKWKGELF
jgi:hypothetical protein